MRWHEQAILDLAAGKETTVRPHGNSMLPRVKSGEVVRLKPCSIETLQKDDIVLCRVKGNVYLHLVKAVQGGRVLIGNNRGGTNGWTRTIYGKKVD